MPRVFLSSRFHELQLLRDKVKRLTQLTADIDIVDLHDGSANLMDPGTRSLAELRASDLMVLLLARTYSVDESNPAKSFTHLEWDEAVRRGIPILAYQIQGEGASPRAQQFLNEVMTKRVVGTLPARDADEDAIRIIQDIQKAAPQLLVDANDADVAAAGESFDQQLMRELAWLDVPSDMPAVVALKDGQLSTAIGLAEQARRSNPSDWSAAYLVARLLDNRGEVNDGSAAAAAAQNAVGIIGPPTGTETRMVESRRAASLVLAARTALALGNVAGARLYADEALARREWSADCLRQVVLSHAAHDSRNATNEATLFQTAKKLRRLYPDECVALIEDPGMAEQNPKFANTVRKDFFDRHVESATKVGRPEPRKEDDAATQLAQYRALAEEERQLVAGALQASASSPALLRDRIETFNHAFYSYPRWAFGAARSPRAAHLGGITYVDSHFRRVISGGSSISAFFLPQVDPAQARALDAELGYSDE